MRQQKIMFLTVFSLLGAMAAGAYLIWEKPSLQNLQTGEIAGIEGEEPSLAGAYLAARHASIAADNEKASYYLSRAMMFDPKDADLRDQAIESYLLAGNIDQAVAIAEKPPEVATPLSTMLLFVENAHRGDWGKAGQKIDRLKNAGLQSVTLPFLKSWVHLAQKGEVLPPDGTLNLKHSFYQSFVNYQNALLYDQAGDADQAAVYYDLCLNDLQVIPQRFVLASMQFYLRQGNAERAAEIYRNYQRANPEALATQVQPLDAVLKQLQAYGKNPMVPTPKEGIAEVMTTMATLLHGEMLEHEALEYVRLALVLVPNDDSATILLAGILDETEKTDQALEVYRRIPPTSPLYRRSLMRQAFLLDNQGKVEEAVKLLRDAAQKQAKPADLYMTLADLERDHKLYRDAIDHYTQALALLGDSKDYAWPLYYTRAISYERSGQWDKAEADLNRSLKLKPGEPDVLNYLAYSWILQNRHMDQAVTMLEQAVATRPDDGHIIDSLAWAYYVTRKYDLALEYIEQAVELMPNDPTVNDHYGDILWQVGRRSEAKFQWERAMFYHPEPADEAKIRQKLEAGLPGASTAATGMSPSSVHEAMSQPAK